MERNYADYGIAFISEPVSKQHGPNKTDRVEWREDAQIPVVQDLDKFREHFGDAPVLAALDGTSFRVMAQGVARSKERNTPVEVLQEIVYNRLRGLNTRTASVRTVTEKVYALPNGETYSGTDENEYQQLYAAALVDSGVDTSVALSIASKQSL